MELYPRGEGGGVGGGKLKNLDKPSESQPENRYHTLGLGMEIDRSLRGSNDPLTLIVSPFILVRTRRL